MVIPCLLIWQCYFILIYHSVTGVKLGDLSQLRRQNLFSATSRGKKKEGKKKGKKMTYFPGGITEEEPLEDPLLNFLNFRAWIFKQWNTKLSINSECPRPGITQDNYSESIYTLLLRAKRFHLKILNSLRDRLK